MTSNVCVLIPVLFNIPALYDSRRCDQCKKSFQLIYNVFDFETRVEIVKNPLSIVHAIFTILGEKLTYNIKG